MSIERKAEKKNLYQDTRDGEEGGENGTNGTNGEKNEKEEGMDDWDEEKLRKVVMSKHGNPKTTTDKVCKYFIDAVENGKYGWFWQCPNGGDKCMYKHSLPVGYVIYLFVCSFTPFAPCSLTFYFPFIHSFITLLRPTTRICLDAHTRVAGGEWVGKHSRLRTNGPKKTKDTNIFDTNGIANANEDFEKDSF